MLVDSHCHLNFRELAENLEERLNAMMKESVGAALVISVSRDSFPEVLSLAHGYSNLYASVGVHPEVNPIDENGVLRRVEFTYDELMEISRDPRVIAIGECGFDYHWHPDCPRWQDARFETHIEASIASDLPIVIHSRKSSEATLSMLSQYRSRLCGGIMHCFSEDWEFAKRALDLGLHISFSGILTFKNAKSVHDVATKVPLDRLLVETDSPYLAPVPHRGKLNEPAFVRYVAERLASLRDMSLEEVAEITTSNFYSLFGKAKRPGSTVQG